MSKYTADEFLKLMNERERQKGGFFTWKDYDRPGDSIYAKVERFLQKNPSDEKLRETIERGLDYLEYSIKSKYTTDEFLRLINFEEELKKHKIRERFNLQADYDRKIEYIYRRIESYELTDELLENVIKNGVSQMVANIKSGPS